MTVMDIDETVKYLAEAMEVYEAGKANLINNLTFEFSTVCFSTVQHLFT